MSRWNRLALTLAFCAVFSACKTRDTTPATSIDAKTCRNSCDEVYNACSRRCHVDDTICPEACVDALATCTRRCG